MLEDPSKVLEIASIIAGQGGQAHLASRYVAAMAELRDIKAERLIRAHYSPELEQREKTLMDQVFPALATDMQELLLLNDLKAEAFEARTGRPPADDEEFSDDDLIAAQSVKRLLSESIDNS
jgi:hypothetical protein